MSPPIHIQPCSGSLGAEIRGVDLAQELTPEADAAIRAAFAEHLLLVFPEQRISPADLMRFGQRFGELLVHPYLTSIDGYPQVHEVRKEPENTTNFGNIWHTDGSFLERPVLALALYAREVPDRGGDTLFINQYLAYDALSPGMKALLDGRRAVHATMATYVDAVASSPNNNSTPVPRQSATHPIVRTHPETGRKALYLGGQFTERLEDMTVEESRGLLDFLHRHSERPEFQFRLRWRKHDVCIWDNRFTMHYALNDYHGKRRVMQRVMVREPSRPS